MESNRDTTIRCLNNREASIINPVADLDSEIDSEEENSVTNGKTSLLAYLLSWQLILQIFKVCSLDKRAKLANFLHQKGHVNDLATCLFCVMPKLSEIKKPDSRGLF